MGNNVYETPRNKSKWHTTNDKNKNHGANFSPENDKNARLQKLRELAKKKKEQSNN